MRIAGNTMQQAIDAENDSFGRDPFAGGLLNLFQNSDDPLVIALNEKWGTGKTVFAKRFEKRATDEEGYTVIYFDAFKRDYDPDVFIALSAELLAKLPTSKTKNSIKKNAKIVGKTILTASFKAAVRAGTVGIINASDLSATAEEIAKEIGDIAEADLDALIDRRLGNARIADETFEKFKCSLAALANTPKTEGGEIKPLLFVVDELDRCRPDYALSVLETIKHFFSVPNVHFLLVCDLDQLASAVHHRYGIKDNGYAYLEKFIDIKISFPILDTHALEIAIETFCDEFARGMGNDHKQIRGWTDLKNTIVRIAINKNYSLRKIEKILSQFFVSIHFANSNANLFDPIFYILCDLKITNPHLFNKAKKGSLTYQEIRDFYQFNEEREEWYTEYLRYIFDPSIDRSDERWRQIKNQLGHSSSRDVSELSKHIANNIVDRIG